MAQHGAKMEPRWSHDGPRWSQDGSRWSQDGPRWSQDVRMCAPRKSKNSPRIAVTQISTSALALKAPLHLLPCGMQVRRPQQPQLTTRSLKAALGRRSAPFFSSRLLFLPYKKNKLPINRFWRPHIINY